MDDIEKRLHKIQGQLEGINKMYQENRNCLDITQQIAATRSALAEVSLQLLGRESSECIQKNDTVKLQKYLKEILKKS